MKRFVLFLLVLVGSYACAQNLRGSITGQVTDPTGAAISNAAVTVTSTDTGATSRVSTTQEGYYTAPGLLPGGYTVKVTAQGFKAFERAGIKVETQQNVTINIKLEIGAASEQITVTATPPLITMADASTGQVLTTEQVEDLPTDGGTPLGFARIAYGAVVKAKHALGDASPTANQTVDDFSLGGGNSASNELLLNGVPNMQDSGRYAGFSPQLDAVDEVRVDVFGANVQYGDTSGGTVNITTKSGTNQFHGSGRWDYRESGCSGLDGKFASRSANHCTWMSALPWSTSAGSNAPTSVHNNQFGGTIGGPIWIPKVFNGHNKLFFFYAYETYRGEAPPTGTYATVPTAAERQGDFSALWNSVTNTGISNKYQLYNPYQVTGTQSNFTRAPIVGNCMGPAATTYSASDCPGNAGLALSPITQAYLKMLPSPNYSGPTTTADGQNNYFTWTPSGQDYRSHQGRIDWNIGARDKIFGIAQRSRNLNFASNYFNTPLSGTTSDQIMAGGQVDEVHTFSPTLFSDLRGSVTRYDNASDLGSNGISPTSLGFPGYLAQNSTSVAIPEITFSDGVNLQNLSGEPQAVENFDTVQLFATVTKIYRAHTFLAGVDMRAYKYSSLAKSYANGHFTFTNGAGGPVSSGNTAPSAQQPFGSALALFMLGIPQTCSSCEQDITAPFQFNSFLHAYFLQDDWKVRPNLTISIGARFEHEIPVNESQNRMVNGFNPTVTNGITTATESYYQAHATSTALAILPAASFITTGGATYATSSNRHPYQVPAVYIDPRLGITWSPEFTHGRGVVRLGFGIFDNPFNDYNTGQSYGYTGSTLYVASADTQMHNNTLSDPFPTSTSSGQAVANPLQLPSGNSMGYNINFGSSMTYYSPVIKQPYAERTSLDVQYQIGNTILIDLGYINTHQVHLSYSNAVSSIPLLPYLSRSQYYDVAVTNWFSGATFATGGPSTTFIPNPFNTANNAALKSTGIPVASTVSSNTQASPSLYLLSWPQFSSVTAQLVPGQSGDYNALNARVAKLMGHGLTLNGVFEWSRLLGTYSQLNSGGPLWYGENSTDYPIHIAGYGTYQLPIGRGRQFFSNDNRILDYAIGGWQISAIYQFLSGTAMSWGNVIYTGNGWKDFNNKEHNPNSVIHGKPLFNTAVFDTRTCQDGIDTKCQNDPSKAAYDPNIQPNSNNYRTFPQYLLRQDNTSDWDANVQKNFSIWENVKAEFRLDCFNLLNRPQYAAPDVKPTDTTFGEDTGGVFSGTNARLFQVGAHIAF